MIQSAQDYDMAHVTMNTLLIVLIEMYLFAKNFSFQMHFLRLFPNKKITFFHNFSFQVESWNMRLSHSDRNLYK